MIAALFVEAGGEYTDRHGVDPWAVERDARGYTGPHPVVAHPPCKRWGRYWHGGPSAKVRRIKGQDGGCFAVALWAVRSFGGVLEHPEASHAWAWYGLERPSRAGGWTQPDRWGGRSCCVEQGHYGHKARKATWLYAVAPTYPDLVWGPSAGAKLDAGYHSAAERAAAKGEHRARRDTGRLTAAERLGTPPAFADMLIEIARSVHVGAR